MIYEFKNPKVGFGSDLFLFVPDATWGLYLTLVVALLIVAYTINLEFQRFRNGGSVPEYHRAIEFGLPTLLYFSIFTHFFHISDEVSINLEHTYNIYHFGRFSMSPHENIDGTVEILFYLLHYPFAFDLQYLAFANFLISLLGGWLILWVLYGWLKRKNMPYRIYILTACAAAWPITGAAATGFGNVLMAVIIAFAIVRLAENRAVSAAVASTCLPLIRPDGLAWSLLLLLMIGFVYFRQILRLTPKQMLGVALLVAAPFAASALYWRLFEVYYGVASSTPMHFKSVSLERLEQFNDRAFVQTVENYILDPAIVSFLLIGLAAFIATLIQTKSMRLETAPKVRILFVLGIGIALPVLLFSAAQATQGWAGNVAYRYWLGASLFAAIAYAISLGLLKDRFGQSVRFVAYAVCAFTVFGSVTRDAPSDSVLANRDWAANAGLMAEQILNGTGLSIGTTEMNTFGLAYVNDHVVDYWGYSNRQIATEGLCGSDRTKYHPTLFLTEKTDVFWPHWFVSDATDPNAQYPMNLLLHFENTYYNDTEYLLAKHHHLNQGNPRLGDMREVMGLYDFVILRSSNYSTAFLVRRAVLETFTERLRALGFEYVRSRETNMDRIADGYLSRPAVALAC